MARGYIPAKIFFRLRKGKGTWNDEAGIVLFLWVLDWTLDWILDLKIEEKEHSVR